MAELYCNLAIKVQLVLKMQLICSLLKNLSFKIIRRLASLLPGKTRRQSSITMLIIFFCGKKIRKENSLNNLTSSILSFSSPPARKVTCERKRAPPERHPPRGWRFSLIQRVHWFKGPVIIYRQGGGEDLGKNKVKFSPYPL